MWLEPLAQLNDFHNLYVISQNKPIIMCLCASYASQKYCRMGEKEGCGFSRGCGLTSQNPGNSQELISHNNDFGGEDLI